MHKLWETQEWQSATDAEIVAALFDAPRHVLPEDMGYIRRARPQCIRTYQQLYYGGQTPHSIAKVRQKAIGF